MEKRDLYTVNPSYCTGNNEPFELSPEDLRVFLINELDESTRKGEDRPDRNMNLEEVLAEGDDHETWIRFDVTRPGSLQSTLSVS